MMKALIFMAMLFGAVIVNAQQPDPNQYLKDPVPHPKFHFADDSRAVTPSFAVENPECRKAECFIFFNEASGNEIVRISQRTGRVTVAHPERSDEAARQFWRALTRAFGQLNCAP